MSLVTKLKISILSNVFDALITGGLVLIVINSVGWRYAGVQ